jgi:DNA-binding transcriptional regulator YhcF (GntR family)
MLSAARVRLWFSPDSEVPIYRQLVTQFVLAILSGDLAPGERLPSTRELARRFRVHPNTISAGYRQLVQEGWAEYRHGSGIYVKSNIETPKTPRQVLDKHISAFFRAVRELDLPSTEVRERVAQWLASPPPDHFLVIDPDVDLREILITEMGELTSLPVKGTSLEGGGKVETLRGAIPLCRPSKTKMVQAILPAGIELITLQIRSAHAWLAPSLTGLKDQLIGVVSHWPEFLTTARTMLAATGVDPDLLILRDTHRPRWTRGLDQTAAIICDVLTAKTKTLPHGTRLLVFSLLADSAREELERIAATADPRKVYPRANTV